MLLVSSLWFKTLRTMRDPLPKLPKPFTQRREPDPQEVQPAGGGCAVSPAARPALHASSPRRQARVTTVTRGAQGRPGHHHWVLVWMPHPAWTPRCGICLVKGLGRLGGWVGCGNSREPHPEHGRPLRGTPPPDRQAQLRPRLSRPTGHSCQVTWAPTETSVTQTNRAACLGTQPCTLRALLSPGRQTRGKPLLRPGDSRPPSSSRTRQTRGFDAWELAWPGAAPWTPSRRPRPIEGSLTAAPAWSRGPPCRAQGHRGGLTLVLPADQVRATSWSLSRGDCCPWPEGEARRVPLRLRTSFASSSHPSSRPSAFSFFHLNSSRS